MAEYLPKGKGKTFLCINEACGKTFVAGNSLAKYCGPECRTVVNNRAAQVRKVDRSERECKWCRQLFTPQYGDRRKVFCSGACKIKHQYKSRSGSGHRRRIKRYGSEYESVDRFVVFNRDGWTCYICGIHTPADHIGTHMPDAPELEHVIALSQGGGHTYSNIRCACRACNNAKAVGERRVAMAKRLAG